MITSDDVELLKVLGTLLTAILSLVAYLLGWFRKLFAWVAQLFKPKPGADRRLRFFPDETQNSFWCPAKIGAKPAMQVRVMMEASNMTDGAYRLMRARLRGYPAGQTNILVKRRAGFHSSKQPIPAREIVPVSVGFIVPKAPSRWRRGKRLKVIIEFTDHIGKKHRVKAVCSWAGP